MPIHMAPALREKELAEEAAGMIVKLDSAGYTCEQNQESAGIMPHTTVVGQVFVINGKQRTAL
jgi:hypothetical protein